VDEFVWHNNSRGLTALEPTEQQATALYGKRLAYPELTAQRVAAAEQSP